MAATPDLGRRLNEALSLARDAQRDRALVCADLTETRAELRAARLDLALARELLAYHGIQEAGDE